MNQTTIHISSSIVFCALLFPSFADQAHAACNPPKDVSSCVIVPPARLAQASPALPEPPFLVTDPQMPNTLVLTHFEPGSKTPEPVPGSNNCSPSNVSACTSVPSADLTNNAIARKSAPFLVRFQDGRSLLASPMAAQ
jgi:hypothetical protein